MVAVGKTEVPVKYLPLIVAASAKYGVPVGLLAAQIDAESSFNPGAVSPDGAIGISQFLPSTAAELGVNPRDPASSIDGQAKLMASYFKKYNSWQRALYAYHDGPGKSDNPGPAGQEYAKKILAANGKIIDWLVPGTPVEDAKDSFKATEAAIAQLRSPDFWKRVGFFAMGGALFLMGMLLIIWAYQGDNIKTVVKSAGSKGKV